MLLNAHNVYQILKMYLLTISMFYYKYVLLILYIISTFIYFYIIYFYYINIYLLWVLIISIYFLDHFGSFSKMISVNPFIKGRKGEMTIWKSEFVSFLLHSFPPLVLVLGRYNISVFLPTALCSLKDVIKTANSLPLHYQLGWFSHKVRNLRREKSCRALTSQVNQPTWECLTV